ncbi:DNA repair exonuclease [Wenzhouxiangella sp. AB-CW3]|uniref:metallophosphoesterase family protein n=1 Tax=Wenzhouxiangella sp. AB-CW3 TaxID=2771012 RepID=UPI00168BFA2B|nr:DNA repair exonuclease [Wenzhouxiangella sp. AB-CW3]QOC23121.1 DNA repair exonuclease [Wenzhouxiangella sp. AB-CW3]
MTTLLAIGDLHLGRPPAALPEELTGRCSQLGPEAAWQAAIREAVEREVDGVLLAGDVVDRSRDFLVAYGHLKTGIEQLADAGIPIVAVAGNHDTHVLPRLAGEIEELHLLGQGGQWETTRVGSLSILGWSFPQPRFRKSPLESLDKADREVTTIGLLHCDRDATDSHHAPVSSAALQDAPVDAWMLGHIHRPDALDGNRPIGYLGSVTALRASEIGPRGPWLVETTSSGLSARHLPLAPLRYETLEIDCTELKQAEHLGERVLAECRTLVARLCEQPFQPQALGLRLRLTGRSEWTSALQEIARELESDGRAWEESGIACFVHRIEVATTPAVNLARLARQSDPCGLLARRLIALEDPDSEEYRRLIAMGRDSLDALAGAREFRQLERKLDDAAVARWLLNAGRIALDRLLEQRGDRP